MEFTRRRDVPTTQSHDEHSRTQSLRQVSNSSSTSSKEPSSSTGSQQSSLETEQAKLKLEFQQVRAQLLMFPEKHPDYNAEWHKFWHKRSEVIRSLGGDPEAYDYTPEWKKIWGERMDELLQIQYTSILDKLRLKYGANSFEKQNSPSLHIPSPEAQSELIPVQEVTTEAAPVDKKPNLINILDFLTKLGGVLGSLTPQVSQFFRMAEDMESSVEGGSHLLLKSRDFLALLATCKSRLLEMMQTEILPPDILSVINVNIYNLSKIIQYSQNQPVRPENETRDRSKTSQFEVPRPSTQTTLTSPAPDLGKHVGSMASNVGSSSFGGRRQYSENRDIYLGEYPRDYNDGVIDYNHEHEKGENQSSAGNSLTQNTATPLTSSSACLSDQDWVDFFTRKEPEVSVPVLTLAPSLLKFISTLPQGNAKQVKSCLRVGPPDRLSETDISCAGPPAPKKSCLRPSSSTARRPDSPPESVHTSVPEPCTKLVETWRKVIVEQRSPTETRRSESKRSESSRSESRRHESGRSESRYDSSRSESSSRRHESSRSDSKRHESSKSESRRSESSRTESKRNESSRSESRRHESSRTESKRTESSTTRLRSPLRQESMSRRSESKRSESNSARAGSPTPLMSIVLGAAGSATSKNYDKSRRAREFLSDSEETEPSTTENTKSEPTKSSDPPKKWVKSFTEGGPPEAPREFSVLSLIKGRDWYQQYMNTTGDKSEKLTKPSSSTTKVSENREKITKPSLSSATSKVSDSREKTTARPSSSAARVDKTTKPSSSSTKVSQNHDKRNKPSSSSSSTTTKVFRNLERTSKPSSTKPKIAEIPLPVGKPVIHDIVTIIDDDDAEPPPPGVSPDLPSTSMSTAPSALAPKPWLEPKTQPGEVLLSAPKYSEF